MSIDELRSEAFHMTRWQRHRFLVLIGGVIVISCVMVAVAMHLYNTSGAAQIDLSRPGYQSVRSEASRDNVPDSSFSSTGELDEAAFRQFNEMYDRHSKRVVGVDSFSPQALSDESLQIYRNQNQTTQE